MGSQNTLNTGICYDLCHDKNAATPFNFTHFGMSEGKQCFCGSDFYEDPAPLTDCGFVCNGREGDLCGGEFRTIIYKVIKDSEPKPIEIAKLILPKIIAPVVKIA